MKKRRSFSNKLNKTKKNKNIVLLVIASIVAAVGTVVFGILKRKRKKNAPDESKDSVTPEVSSASNKVVSIRPKPPARFAHRKLQPGELDWEQLAKEKEVEQIRRGEIPEHMLADARKPRSGIKRRKWKLALPGVAALLAVTAVSINIAQYLRPSEAMAKESFSGISKIVAEHDGTPYRILNIVPMSVQWPISEPDGDVFTFSTGTMDYLAGGQVLSEELRTALTGNPVFCHYASREEMINKLIPESSVDAFPWIKYEEAYGGVHDVSTSDGWTLLFESRKVSGDENYTDVSGIDPAEMSDGIFYGNFVKYVDGEDRSGYDFIWNDGAQSTDNKTGLTDRYVYVLDDSDGDGIGTYFAVSLEDFADMPEGTVAYRAVVSSEFSGVAGAEIYPDNVAIYTYDEGRYVYQGTVGEVFKDYRYDKDNDDGSISVTPSDDRGDSEDNTDSSKTPVQDSGTTSDSEQDPGTTPDSEQDPGTTPDSEQDPGTTPDSEQDPEITPDPAADPELRPDSEQSIHGETSDVNVMSSEGAMLDISRNTVFTGGWRRLVEEDPALDSINDPLATIQTDGSISPTVDLVEDGVPGTEEPAEDDSGSDTMYYRLTFERIEADELSDLYTVDDAVSEDEASDDTSLLDTSVDPYATFIYVGPGLGNYQLTAASDENGNLIKIYNAPIYYRCQTGNDWLKQYVFNSLSGGDNENSSFQIEVKTVRADEVDLKMVNNADLIYLESDKNMFLNPLLAADYIQHDDNLIYSKDMSTFTVRAILSRATDDLMPVIVDYAIMKEEDPDKYAGTNYQLLAKALLKRNLAGYFEAMDTGSDLMVNIKMNQASDDYPDKSDNDYNYVNQNVYVVNTYDGLVWSDFNEFLADDRAEAGFNEVLVAIKAENTTLAKEDKISLKVSKARAIQYIINYSVGIMGEFDHLTILELQPTANTDSDLGQNDEKTKLYWKNWKMESAGKQILYSNKPFSVTKDIKSVAEFNGEWEDINGIYDMVFIGLDGEKLNQSNDLPRRAVYNNPDLDGIVYHLGDESGSGTYDSSDITSQKKQDLLEYLQAGYPIVVENNFFTDGTARGASEKTINKKYIAYGTEMYDFLKEAVTGEDYKDSIFTVSDTISDAGFMASMKITRPRIELVNEDTESNSDEKQEVSILQWLRLDENNEYHGRIAYQVKNSRGGDYGGNTAIHLYADLNYDGFFGEEEELGEEFGAYTNEDNVIDVTINGMGPGIIPWKLEVTDIGENGNDSNPYRRASVQGYFELLSDNEEQIRVLQVTTEEQNPSVDLKQIYNTKEDSMLAYYLRAAEGMAKISFEFETITPDTLIKNLANNAKYLNQWDIVVLTVDDTDAVYNPAIVDYINEGRSLLVCNQNKNLEKEGFDPELLGWYKADDNDYKRKTYVSLGTGKSNLHRYADLKAEMYEAQHGTLRAEKINEGSIFYYPYPLNEGSSLNLGDTESGLRASEYLLNFDNNLKSKPEETYVTVWVTLGGNSSTAYGISPRDARNNYYCYSKGNVVYLAQSEYQYTYDAANKEIPDNNEGADECQFFVNALMAAYSAGVHGADVSVVSGYAQTSTPVKSISVPFDQEWRNTQDDNTQGILDETVDVYFKFEDSNIGANKKVKVSFYYEDPGGEREFVVNDKIVTATPFSSDIWTVTDNKLVQLTPGDPQNPDGIGIAPGKVYQIKAPAIPLKVLSAVMSNETENNAGIYVLVESEFVRNGRTYEAEGFATVSLNRAQLFLLE